MNETQSETAVRQALKKAPLLSHATSRLLEISGRPDYGIVEIVQVVKNDAVLTSQVLKVVNSAAYARQKPIYSVRQAVALLGGDLVVSIALYEAASLYFKKQLNGYGTKAGALWVHSIKAALAAKILAGRARRGLDQELAFTCTLLHDLGKAVLSDFLVTTPRTIGQFPERQQFSDYLAAEKTLLGLDHAEAGHELCVNWKLPAPLPQIVRWHHQPWSAEEQFQPLAYIVYLADMVAIISGAGTGAEPLQHTLDPGYEEHIELDDQAIAEITMLVEQEFSSMVRVFWE